MSHQPTSPLDLPGTKKYFNIGETIIKEGDTSEGLFVLLQGKVGVYKKDLSVAEIKQRGTVFGELGLILGIPRTATIQALEPTFVLFVKLSLEELVLHYPQLTKKILKGLAERLSHTTEMWWYASEELGEST
jgi:CRP-like cAMP-binding protein